MATVREIALGWDPARDPSEAEYSATVSWLRMSSDRPAGINAFQEDKLRELVRRFKATRPDVYPPAAAAVDHENECNWDGLQVRDDLASGDKEFAICLDHGGKFELRPTE